jgi:ubiquinone/menaquinone biosynthesis C-methylase UbiE
MKTQYRCEIDRISDAYERRKEKIPSQVYSLFNPASLFMLQRREQEIINTLRLNGITSLQDKKILDIGCGTGAELRNFIGYGAKPENLCGIDLLPERIETSKRISPNIDVRCDDASSLPYEDKCFDIVMQFTVFTSILDGDMKTNIAAEMLRVLKTNGMILWYDYHMNNPRNPDVRGIKKKEIRKLFPCCAIHLTRITLAPPLGRVVAPHSSLAYYLLERVPFLQTHYLGVIKKPQNASDLSI